MTKNETDLTPERIKQLRERLNMSQDEMANLLDVSVGTIHRWEQGKTTPRPRRRKQLKLLEDKVSDFGGETVKHGIEAWLTFSPGMMRDLSGASVEMLMENSFNRWVDVLRQSANQFITQTSEIYQPEEEDEEAAEES